jgi:hypothetical protein
MASAGDNLIESTARALLRERIEATPWFRIKMTQEQRRVRTAVQNSTTVAAG